MHLQKIDEHIARHRCRWAKARLMDFSRVSMVVRVGPLATIGCEPRQARKGAAVVTDSGAGVWLARPATLSDYA